MKYLILLAIWALISVELHASDNNEDPIVEHTTNYLDSDPLSDIEDLDPKDPAIIATEEDLMKKEKEEAAVVATTLQKLNIAEAIPIIVLQRPAIVISVTKSGNFPNLWLRLLEKKPQLAEKPEIYLLNSCPLSFIGDELLQEDLSKTLNDNKFTILSAILERDEIDAVMLRVRHFVFSDNESKITVSSRTHPGILQQSAKELGFTPKLLEKEPRCQHISVSIKRIPGHPLWAAIESMPRVLRHPAIVISVSNPGDFPELFERILQRKPLLNKRPLPKEVLLLESCILTIDGDIPLGRALNTALNDKIPTILSEILAPEEIAAVFLEVVNFEFGDKSLTKAIASRTNPRILYQSAIELGLTTEVLEDPYRQQISVSIQCIPDHPFWNVNIPSVAIFISRSKPGKCHRDIGKELKSVNLLINIIKPLREAINDALECNKEAILRRIFLRDVRPDQIHAITLNVVMVDFARDRFSMERLSSLNDPAILDQPAWELGLNEGFLTQSMVRRIYVSVL